MAKYRKKPVVIEAVQYTYPASRELLMWLRKENQAFWFSGERLFLNTLEGTMCATPGDYVILGIHRELYPCKPDIFQKTYEKVE